MAINDPIIVAGPSKPRGQIISQPIQTYPVGPGESYNTPNDTGGFTTIIVGDPTHEGQVMFHVGADGLNRSAVMYVGVEINSTLTWVSADFTSYVAKYTGQPYDPIYS